MFKVVTDQLKISQGWVRCGRCTEVFDATAQMQAPAFAEGQDLPAASEITGSRLIRESADELPEAVRDTASPPDQPKQNEDFQAGVGSAHAIEGHAVAGALHQPPPLETPGLAGEIVTPIKPLKTADPAEPEGVRTTTRTPTPQLLALKAEPEDEPGGLPQDVSFVREARRKAFWRQPKTRLSLMIAAVLLLAALLFQVAVHERDRLVAGYPALASALRALCAPLGCEIQPMQRIEAVVIDSSSFNKLGPDAYRLGFSLKNSLGMPVAMPSLELTLTDSQDRPLVRRVLRPAELGARSLTLAAGDEFSGVLTLRADSGAAPAPAPSASAPAAAAETLRVVGYRLLAFYP